MSPTVEGMATYQCAGHGIPRDNGLRFSWWLAPSPKLYSQGSNSFKLNLFVIN